MITRKPLPLAENYATPGNSVLVDIGVCHPRDGAVGVLIRNMTTGIYSLDVAGCGVLRSVPQDWAKEVAAESNYIGAMVDPD